MRHDNRIEHSFLWIDSWATTKSMRCSKGNKQSTGSCWLSVVLVSNINSPRFSLCFTNEWELCLLLQLTAAVLLFHGTLYACLFLSACPSGNPFCCFIWIPHCFSLELPSWSGETDWEFFDAAAQGLYVGNTWILRADSGTWYYAHEF